MTVGRKPFEPTEKQRQLVQTLAGYGIPQPDIAQLVQGRDGRPISIMTLEKYFRDELDTGATRANAVVAGALYKKATIGNDTTAMIFWLKTRARWRETNHLTLSSPSGGPVQLQPVQADLGRLSNDELQQMEALLAKAGGAQQLLAPP